MPKRTLNIDPNGKLHADLVCKIQSRYSLATLDLANRHYRWLRAEELVLSYLPEGEADIKRRSKRENEGQPKYTTIMIPYTYAVLMSAHTYWTSVFFARSPVHQFMGLHGEGENQVLALEALINYQVEVGEMLAPYYIWLYDAGKYGLGVLGQYWTVEKIHYGELAEIDMGQGPQLFQATHEVEGYRGNKVYNISPYDFMPDPRVPLGRFQDGEFCFVRKRLGWADIQARVRDGYYVNTAKLKEHISPDRGANEGSAQLRRPDFSRQTFTDEKGKENHPAGMTFLEMYVMLIPKEWGLGDSTYPQKWCITITEDMGLIVGCSPLGYIHGRFPIDILEPEVEGYGVVNRGIPEIIEPIQNVMDWLINTHFTNVRASLNNQFIIDPSKLVIKDAKNSSDPGFVWRLRPEAYGTDITKMFMQVPVHDVTQAHMNDLQGMLTFGERALGINDQIMGVLNQGGRKTATEVRTSTGFGVNRQKTIVEYLSAAGMLPHTKKLVQTSQQMYDVQGKLRVVGDLAMTAGPRFMQVTPEDIAGFFSYVPVDGALPVDRQAQANLWKEVLMGLTRMPPQIAMTYDISKIFAWMAQLGGLKNINQMKIQVMPNEQLQQQATAGNVIPMRGAPPQGALPPPPPQSGPGGPGTGSPDMTTQMGQNAVLPPTGA